MKQDTAVDAITTTSLITLSLAEINMILTFCGLVIAIPIAVFRLLLLIRQWREGRSKTTQTLNKPNSKED